MTFFEIQTFKVSFLNFFSSVSQFLSHMVCSIDLGHDKKKIDQDPGVVSQGSYFIPKLTLVHWGGQPGLLLHTTADWLTGWSVRAPIIYSN